MPITQQAGKTANKFEWIQIESARYLSIREPERIKKQLAITLSNHSYLPRTEDLRSDWVAHVAVPAFKLHLRQRGGKFIQSFCSIGTGSGLDVLSAIEILGPKRVGLTDVHEDVVATAVDNVSSNHLDSHPLVIEAGYGDLLEPLRHYKPRYDLIYENLPNVPLSSESEVASERKSSGFLAPRREPVPELICQQMLDLHYLALWQAKEFLAPGGAIFSILGARVPLEVFLSLGKLAGFAPSFQTFGWKIQGDPLDIIGEHARKQVEGFGPFHFYRADVLKRVFDTIDPSISGRDALQIEQALIPERLDAVSALKAFNKGEVIGHTVAVLKSEVR